MKALLAEPMYHQQQPAYQIRKLQTSPIPARASVLLDVSCCKALYIEDPAVGLQSCTA